MRKRLLSVMLVLCLVLTTLPAEALAAEATVQKPDPQVSMNAIQPLKVSRKLTEVKAAGGIEPYSKYGFGQNSVISGNLSHLSALAYSFTFSDQAEFPSKENLPAGYDPDTLLEWGKAPGLNVDILHKHGFTGKGAVIAYVDQPIGLHPQYSGVKLHYTNNTDSDSSMHGPSVLSLLAGKDIGTAPDAEVYYYGHASWKADQTTHAECLYQIIEQNKKLPSGEKITMVGFSDNIDESETNAQAFRDAVAACEKAGIMVWFCQEYRAASFLPYSDKNNPQNVVHASWSTGDAPLVYVPTSGRTTAATMDGSSYIYWSSGGLSWAMPYVLGLYAIAIDIDPTLSQNDLRTLIKDTAYEINDMKLVNPVGFVAAVLQRVGRGSEGDAMLQEVKARTRYLYAVMDTAAMSKEDLNAVSSYLSSITDATVLVANVRSFASAEAIYTALQSDSKQRGGITAGVQIFGTSKMVPAFQVQYKVQMPEKVDNGGYFLTDLFYGNFDNDVKRIANGYNVMDHFAKKWDVTLVPQWPVARLPLSKGEFSAFFARYAQFVDDTGLVQQDLVNFSNPIFGSVNHIDDMGKFLTRMDKEFHLMNVPYRLYGNQDGSYPVTTSVIGGFSKENLSKENSRGIMELLINSHGQWNNIDQCVFEGDKEKRISLVNMETINKVLDESAYYLDCWTCLNGYDMANNLTTTALNGKCVGMFSATAVISNNGVNCNASLSELEKSNFYYFYYQYLKSLYDGQSRSRAFLSAQQAYGNALLKDSKKGIGSGDANYQFNLCNLLTYHNFGVLEPNAAWAVFDANGYIKQSAQSVAKTEPAQPQSSPEQPKASASNVPADGEDKVAYTQHSELKTGKVTIHSFTFQTLDDGSVRFTIDYTAPSGMSICVFDPPDGDHFKLFGSTNADSSRDTYVFELSEENLKSTDEVSVNFFIDDNNRCIVSFSTSKLK